MFITNFEIGIYKTSCFLCLEWTLWTLTGNFLVLFWLTSPPFPDTFMVKRELMHPQIMCQFLWSYKNSFIFPLLQKVEWGWAWEGWHLGSREISHQQDSQRCGQHNNRKTFTVHFFPSQSRSFLPPPRCCSKCSHRKTAFGEECKFK